MTMQVTTRNNCILYSALYYCIIADEWSCRYSNKEYCSTSPRIVTDKLKCNIIFLGFTNIANTRAENLTSAIMHAIQRDEPQVDLNKCIAQMYDGAMVIQGYLSGVQEIIKDEYCLFSLNLHYFNHQLQLGAK